MRLCKPMLKNLPLREIWVASVTDVILVASCNSRSRENTLARRKKLPRNELICLTSSLLLLLNHDNILFFGRF